LPVLELFEGGSQELIWGMGRRSDIIRAVMAALVAMGGSAAMTEALDLSPDYMDITFAGGLAALAGGLVLLWWTLLR
jgi:hypothetical protein